MSLALRSFPSTCLDVPREGMKNFSHDT
jgi:hypothetical protein